jgi:ribosomal protein S18 acetylase RimI-like enzyme
MMIQIQSPIIDPSIEALLSYATSKDKIDCEYQKYIHSSNRILYGLIMKGVFVGCIGIKFVDSSACEIKHIAVSPTERGKGIGSRMITFVSEKHLLRCIFAETDQDEVKFYQNFGFEITSLGEKYPGVERFLCKCHNIRRLK